MWAKGSDGAAGDAKHKALSGRDDDLITVTPEGEQVTQWLELADETGQDALIKRNGTEAS